MSSQEAQTVANDEARMGIERRAKLRGTLRGLMVIVIMIYLALAFCLSHISATSPEYYISMFTLLLNTLLMVATLTADRLLARGIRKCEREIAARQAKLDDKADPWQI